MKKDGLVRMLEFLVLLSDRRIEFRIEQQSPDDLIVHFALVGARIEVTFEADAMDYCVFSGSETVSTDIPKLIALIDANK